MADKKRSYLNPEFEFDVGGKSAAQLKDMASWNWDLLKRKIKKHYLQYKSDKEFAKENPKPEKPKGLIGGGRQRKQLLDLEKENY